ncbi:hypothetical protein [Euzebya sp.]|uniref:hypothetical protein n=1 Tax=Euzebya sp. TaxID=1971409 RepID=UPI003514FFB4
MGAIRERLAALAADAALPDPGRVADDLVVVYQGVLTAFMVDPVAVAVDRGRALARRVAVDQ